MQHPVSEVIYNTRETGQEKTREKKRGPGQPSTSKAAGTAMHMDGLPDGGTGVPTVGPNRETWRNVSGIGSGDVLQPGWRPLSILGV